MSAPVEISLDNLAHLPIWVGWREERRNGIRTKVPYSPGIGWKAESNNPATRATRKEAENWAATNYGSGVGIMLGSQLNGGDCFLCGIDLDTCRNPATETLQDWAQEVIGRFQPTYVEVSPSGTGAKILFVHTSADSPAIEKLFKGQGGRQFKNGGGEHCPAIEVYRAKRFFTITDESIGPSDTIRQVSFDDLEWLVLDARPKFAHKESATNSKSGSGNDQSRSAAKPFAGAPCTKRPVIPTPTCATRCL
jgi:putative DNA primase/helicase